MKPSAQNTFITSHDCPIHQQLKKLKASLDTHVFYNHDRFRAGLSQIFDPDTVTHD